MPYRTVFDLAEQPPFEPIVAWIAAAFIVTGTAWALIRRVKDRQLAPLRQRPKLSGEAVVWVRLRTFRDLSHTVHVLDSYLAAGW